ncbi:MAG: cation-transporting P-type ATPase, partial [Cyanobacteria bacterium J06649_5]
MPCHELSATEVIIQFDSHLDGGLSAEDVAQRAQTFGWNELPEKAGQPAWLRFCLQFHDPLLYILLIAGAVKAALGSWTN